MRDQFLIEVPHGEIDSLDVLEERFSAWVHRVYHPRVHSETGEAPAERFSKLGPARIPDAGLVREAFLFSEWRTVTKTAAVSLFSNHYEVDQALVGRRVELVFDPFDLADITVRYMDTDFGKALPRRIGRHAHPMVVPSPPEGPPSGIDYLRLVDEQHRSEQARKIDPLRFVDLADEEGAR